MATTVALLQAVLSADTRRFDSAMGKSDTRMKKVGKTAGLLGLAIAGGLAVAFKVGFKEMADSQKVMAQTEAVIKSTGGVANVTAAHVDGMAQSLLELSGVDDELIASSENVLLTFRNIRNEIGQGNDIFDQATKATLDFSTAMGLDLNAAALSVGKALNDPIKGMTKLQRQGVTFTAEQENLIRSLVESGQTMEAQKVILAELTAEFGGSAKAAGETLPAQLSKAREAFADVAAQLVEALLPAMVSVLGHLSTFLNYLKEHPKLAKGVVIGLAALAAALILASVAQMALNLAVLANPFVAAAVGIALLIAGLIVLWQKVEFVRKHWQLLLLGFGIGPVIVATMVKAIIRHFGTLKEGVEFVRQKFAILKNFISGTLKPAVASVFGFFKDKVNGVRDAISSLIGKLQTALGWVRDLARAISTIPSFGIGGGNPGVHPGTGAPRPPRLATGGDITRTGLAFVHRGERVLSAQAVNRGGGAGTLILNNYGVLGSEREVMNWLDRADKRRRRRGGAL